jgi:acetylglutamate kinase
MEVVKMVLVGKVNKELVSAINTHGRLAVGIAGDDGNLIKARPVSERLGRAGEVEAIDATVVTNLIDDGFIPVIATVGYGEDGGSYNINADLVAGELASALGADKVIFLTDVDGLYADFADKSSLISALSLAEAEELIAEDRLNAGMIPKVGACARALKGGVRRAHILNGTVPHALLLEVYTDEGVGTMITADGTGAAGLVGARSVVAPEA